MISELMNFETKPQTDKLNQIMFAVCELINCIIVTVDLGI